MSLSVKQLAALWTEGVRVEKETDGSGKAIAADGAKGLSVDEKLQVVTKRTIHQQSLSKSGEGVASRTIPPTMAKKSKSRILAPPTQSEPRLRSVTSSEGLAALRAEERKGLLTHRPSESPSTNSNQTPALPPKPKRYARKAADINGRPPVAPILIPPKTTEKKAPTPSDNRFAVLSPRTDRAKKVLNRARSLSVKGHRPKKNKSTSAPPEGEFLISAPNNGEVKEEPIPAVALVKVEKKTAEKWWAAGQSHLGPSTRHASDLQPTIRLLAKYMAAIGPEIFNEPIGAARIFQLMTCLKMTAKETEKARNHSLDALEHLVCLTLPEYAKHSDDQKKAVNEISTQILKSFFPKMRALKQNLEQKPVHIYVQTDTTRYKVDKQKLIDGIEVFCKSAWETRVSDIVPSGSDDLILLQGPSLNHLPDLLKKWELCLHSNQASFSETCTMMEHYFFALNKLESTYTLARQGKIKVDETDKATPTSLRISIEKDGKTARLTITEPDGTVKQRNAEDLLAQLGKELATYLPPLLQVSEQSRKICTLRENNNFPYDVEQTVGSKFNRLCDQLSRLLSSDDDTLED